MRLIVEVRSVIAVAVLAAGCMACGASDEEIAQTIENAVPLIAAIKAFDAESGAPPSDLQALVPKYIQAIPRTGISSTPSYSYSTGSKGPRSWWLSVRVGGSAFRHMRYDPQRQFEIPVTDLDGGWVMLNP